MLSYIDFVIALSILILIYSQLITGFGWRRTHTFRWISWRLLGFFLLFFFCFFHYFKHEQIVFRAVSFFDRAFLRAVVKQSWFYVSKFVFSDVLFRTFQSSSMTRGSKIYVGPKACVFFLLVTKTNKNSCHRLKRETKLQITHKFTKRICIVIVFTSSNYAIVICSEKTILISYYN